MENLTNNIFNKNFAEDAVNRTNPDESAFANGIAQRSEILSSTLNGYFYSLSEAIQYLQFSGGLYSPTAQYSEGNICSLLIKKDGKYIVCSYRRNANNSETLSNNPPILDATVDTVNGIDVYEGGSENTDWDLLPAQSGKIKAGKNIEITEESISENTIEVSGGVSKSYTADLQVYENDLITYEGKLYIANTDFTASDFETDKVNLTIVGGEIDKTNTINIWNAEAEYQENQYVATEETVKDTSSNTDIPAIKIYKSKTANTGKTPSNSPDDFDLKGIAPSKFIGGGGDGFLRDWITGFTDSATGNAKYKIEQDGVINIYGAPQPLYKLYVFTPNYLEWNPANYPDNKQHIYTLVTEFKCDEYLSLSVEGGCNHYNNAQSPDVSVGCMVDSIYGKKGTYHASRLSLNGVDFIFGTNNLENTHIEYFSIHVLFYCVKRQEIPKQYVQDTIYEFQ